MTTIFELKQADDYFMESFLILLKEKPLHKINVRELCQKSGYNRSTFYYYFDDIYDLNDKMQDRLVERIIAEIDFQRQLSDEDFVESLTSVYNAYADVIIFLNQKQNFYERYKEALKPIVFQVFGIREATLEVNMSYEFAMGGILSLLAYHAKNQLDMTMPELTAFIQKQLEPVVVKGDDKA